MQNADRERTNENNNRDQEIRPVHSATVLSDRAGLVAATGGDSVGVRQMLDGHGRQPRPLGWSFMEWRQACIASRNGDYGTLGILVEGGWSGGWSDGRRNVSPDWLINYAMQAVHPVYRQPVL